MSDGNGNQGRVVAGSRTPAAVTTPPPADEHAGIMVDNSNHLLYVPRTALPSWMQVMGVSVDNSAGITFAIDIVERDGEEPRMVLHAWPELVPPSHPTRPIYGGGECSHFPRTIVKEVDGKQWVQVSAEVAPLAQFLDDGVIALGRVKMRVWRFVGQRADGTVAAFAAATRRKDPLAELLDWMDSVGGRQKDYWKKVAAVGVDRREEVPALYTVHLRTTSDTTIWKGEVYASDHQHAAEGLTDKLALADALRENADRIIVRGPEDAAWFAYPIENLYTLGEQEDALAQLSAEQQQARAVAQMRRTAVTAEDAALMRDADGFIGRAKYWFKQHAPRLGGNSPAHARVGR